MDWSGKSNIGNIVVSGNAHGCSGIGYYKKLRRGDWVLKYISRLSGEITMESKTKRGNRDKHI